jgi:hypothetical protein
MTSKKEKRVKVVVEIEQSTLWYLFNEAHRLDITLNQMVDLVLKKYIAELESGERKVRLRP